MSGLQQSTGLQQQARQVQRLQLSQQAVQQLQFLQLPLAALATELRQRAERNPFLEYQPPKLEIAAGSPYDAVTADLRESTDRNYLASGFEGYGDTQDWVDRQAEAEHRERFFIHQTEPETLYRHLEKQVLEGYPPGAKRDLILFVCDALDADGYLRYSPYQLLCDWWEAHRGQPEISEEQDVVAAIAEVQALDPPGVGARSLAECLELQVRADATYAPERALRLKLCHHLALLCPDAGENRERIFERLAKRLRCSPEQVAAALAYLRTLNPFPGRSFTAERPPDPPEVLAVRHTSGFWEARCNEQLLPTFRLDMDALADAKARTISPDDRLAIATFEAQARLWTEAYQDRNETLRRVAQLIFNHQQTFLESGGDPATLKPLLQKTIAEALGYDESTISRAIKDKIVRIVPARKLLPLKEFFSRALPQTSGTTGEVFSDQQAKQALKALVDAEDSARPLSDQTLTEALQRQGFSLKRRTVAKYRELLGIPSTRERRRNM